MITPFNIQNVNIDQLIIRFTHENRQLQFTDYTYGDSKIVLCATNIFPNFIFTVHKPISMIQNINERLNQFKQFWVK